QVLLDREVGEHLPPLGHVDDPTAHDRDRIALERGPLEVEPVGGARQQPRDDLQQRRLAGAVRAGDADHLAGAHVEVEPVQDHGLPVAHHDVADLQTRAALLAHASSPPTVAGVSSSTSTPMNVAAISGRSRTSWGSPLPMTLP